MSLASSKLAVPPAFTVSGCDDDAGWDMLEYVRQILNGHDVAFEIGEYFSFVVVANYVEGAETD